MGSGISIISVKGIDCVNNIMLSRSASILRSRLTTKRSFGWIKKNERIEELSGLREATYREYALTPKELLWHTFFLFIPISVLYCLVKADQKEFYSKIGGSWLNFGLIGPMTSAPSPVSIAMAAAEEEEE